jgi:acyl carrier protein
VLAQVRDILITRLKVERAPEEIDPDVFLFGTGLGLDSVDAVELVVALEEQLGLKLPEGARTLQSLRTVGTVIDKVLGLEVQE